MKTNSLAQAISIWGQTKKVINTKLVSFLRIALKLYVLPKSGYVTATQLSPSTFSKLCNQIECSDLDPTQVLKTFDEAFVERLESKSISPLTKKNYRSALSQFFNWLKTQDWYDKSELIEVPELPKRSFARRPLSKSYNDDRLYGLKEEDLTSTLHGELEKYQSFWSQGSSISPLSSNFEGSQAERKAWRLIQVEQEIRGEYALSPRFKGVKAPTINQRTEYILRFLGWCINIEGYAIQQVSLQLIVSQSLYKPYINWLTQHRSCSSTAGIKVIDTAISVAKYYSFQDSSTVDWSDIPLVVFLRQQKKLYEAQNKLEQPAKQQAAWEQKEITHEEAREVIEYLHRTLCSPQYVLVKENGSKTRIKRDLSTVFDNWQTYLMILILVYAPIRQEELRKLRIGTTLQLVEDSNGILRYAVRIKDHKRVSKTRKPRYYPLPSILTQDITKFIQEIRLLAINAPTTEENWLNFWDFDQGKIIRLEQRVQKFETADAVNEKYFLSANQRLRAMKNRLNAREVAKSSAETCDHLFFALGRSYPTSFCHSFEKVHYGAVTNRILRAMGNATLALYGEPKFLNPQGFRHISSKHLRLIGKSSQKDKFSNFIGHSIEINNSYANQIINEYDLIECIVDNWWHEP